jgi:hypothetical protein
MNEQLEQIPLSNELLELMRNAAATAQRLKEPFITTRAILLALLDEPSIGPALVEVLPREKLEGFTPEGDVKKLIASRRQEPAMEPGERPSILRFDTLAFKTPDGATSVWLSREAFTAFAEGAQRAEGVYLPKHLAFGIAADAIRSQGILNALQIPPGAVSEALLSL